VDKTARFPQNYPQLIHNYSPLTCPPVCAFLIMGAFFYNSKNVLFFVDKKE